MYVYEADSAYLYGHLHALSVFATPWCRPRCMPSAGESSPATAAPGVGRPRAVPVLHAVPLSSTQYMTLV